MSNRWRWVSAVAVGCVLLVSQPMAASAQSGADDGWELPRTAWGDPDLQGVWTSATLTPLERPARQAGRDLLTDEEAAALEQQSAASRAASDGRSAPGSVGGYNQVWLDAGTRITGSRRTSLIVDPPTAAFRGVRASARPTTASGRATGSARSTPTPMPTPGSAASPTGFRTWCRCSPTT